MERVMTDNIIIYATDYHYFGADMPGYAIKKNGKLVYITQNELDHLYEQISK